MHFLRKHRAFSAQEVLNVFVAISRGTSSSQEPRAVSAESLKRAQIRQKGPRLINADKEQIISTRAKNETLLAIC